MTEKGRNAEKGKTKILENPKKQKQVKYDRKLYNR